MTTEETQHHLLIVDDVTANIKTLTAILSNEYRIYFATSGQKALEIAKTRPVDLVLLDIIMPEMDGYEVCRQLKANPTTQDCPVIFITGVDDAQSEQLGLELGAVDYIAKPFSPAVVRARVKNHLTLARTLRQIKQQYQALQEAELLHKQVEHITRHDMKSPLNGVIGFASFLMQCDDIPDERKLALNIIRQEGYRALHMINLSLGLLRMEQGIYALSPQPVDLVATLRDVQTDLSPLIHARKVRLTIQQSAPPTENEEPFWVWGESLLCYSALANLIKNALEASPSGGAVEISLREETTMNAVTIRNQGAIPPSIRGRMFEKYVTHGKTTGTGLGGYSAKLMTEVQRGTLSLAHADDQETIFCLRLPKIPENISPESVESFASLGLDHRIEKIGAFAPGTVITKNS